MFSGFMYAVEKCLKMNRILIIDFIIHDGFKRNFSDYFEITNKKLKYSENYDIIPDKDKMIYNTLLDMYVILHSNYFIPCINSGYSRYILYMINNKDNIFDIK